MKRVDIDSRATKSGNGLTLYRITARGLDYIKHLPRWYQPLEQITAILGDDPWEYGLNTMWKLLPIILDFGSGLVVEIEFPFDTDDDVEEYRAGKQGVMAYTIEQFEYYAMAYYQHKVSKTCLDEIKRKLTFKARQREAVKC